jgi:hypothetical protein
MFDKIVVRAQRLTDIQNPLDIGLLAEALVFYGDVTLIANRPIVQQLLRTVGAEMLVRLLEEKHLRLAISENFTGIVTKDAGTPHERYDSMLGELQAPPGGGPIVVERAIVADDFVSAIGKIGLAQRLAQRAADMTTTVRVNQRVGEQIKRDLRSPQFLSDAAADVIRDLAPDYELPKDFRFVAEEDQNRELLLRTNVDFERANQVYRRAVPRDHSSLTPAYVLSLIAAAREALAGC